MTTPQRPLDLLVRVVAGSRLYGTARPESDYDYRGVYWEPIRSLLGLYSVPEGPVADDLVAEPGQSLDAECYPLRRFYGLALGNNPNILDIAFAPPESWHYATETWAALYAYRDNLLSQRVRKTYVGYAHAKMRRVAKPNDPDQIGYDTKDAAHLLRLIRQGLHILKHGTFSPRLEGDDLAMVRDALRGKFTLDTLLYHAQAGIEAMDTTPSDLPMEPDRAAWSTLIETVYWDHMRAGC